MSVGPERIDTVVVAVDGSEFSQRALPVAQRLARRLDATILLFSAVPTEDDVPTRRTELSAAAGTLEGVKVEEDVVVNVDPAGAIHETLKRIGNAVPCMTSHGRGRSAAVLGSVANEVLARGHDPLVLVGPMGDEETDGKGICAAVDEHPGSPEVVLAAQRWAELLDEHLTVVTVAEPVPPPVTVGPPRRRFGPDEDVDAFLHRLVHEVLGPDADVETKAIYDPISPSAGLCTYLRDRPVWLLALGSHARTGIERLVLGDAAAATVRCSRSPALVVPRKER